MRVYRMMILLGIVVVIFLTYMSQNYWLPLEDQPPPVILAWTAFWYDYTFMTPDLQELNCPVSDCVVTTNRSLLESADAVLFHWPDMKNKDLPEMKFQGQRWVLINFESPVNNVLEKLAKITSQLDWTVTYRLDSDMYTPYGCIRPRMDTDSPPEELNKTAFQRKLPIAWMVSDCASKSNREKWAKQIMAIARVDVFGKCAPEYGQTTNSVPNGQLTGYANLSQRYKIYLSFENSICEDYVTEKAYLPLLTGMIPVVLGGANYERVLPPGSFINAMNFSSPKLLAQHLTEVSNNFTLYSQYMEWRKNFVAETCELNRFFCDICARLHNNVKGSVKRNLLKLWDAKSSCKLV